MARHITKNQKCLGCLYHLLKKAQMTGPSQTTIQKPEQFIQNSNVMLCYLKFPTTI